MEFLAKPSGVTLEQHTENVRAAAKELLEARPFVAQKYFSLTNQDLSELLDQAAFWHDKGKAHPQWQNACRADYEEYRERGRTSGSHLRYSGIRHELASLVMMKNQRIKLPRCGWAAVAAHHGKLGERSHKRWHDRSLPKWKIHADFWQAFQKTSNSFRADDPESFEKVLLKRYEYDGPRAWLQLADHRASAKEDGEVSPDLAPFFYEFSYDEPRGVQKLVTHLWDEPFAILRAPTGAGKTDASLIWAQHQIKEKRADRLVIAMPTRFTSNALSVSIADNLGKRGLYHSSARFFEESLIYQKHGKSTFDEDYFEKEMTLARLLETPVTVTTIDHLCIALTGAREDHHSIFWGLAHSCVVIDEADFYDDFTQRNLIVLLRALRILKVPVLMMSATVPDSARRLYMKSGFSPQRIYEDTSDIDRPRCRIHRQLEGQKIYVNTPEDIAHLLLQPEDVPIIIYANTVERAQMYRRWFEEMDFPDDDVILYHSRFCEPDKVAIEKKLYEMMGHEAWENNEQRGVAILTQIGELSINISADIMVSDLCPIDRLAQRAGRLSRFHNPAKNIVGDLYVVLPIRDDKESMTEWYPAPYGKFLPGKGWGLTDLLRKSEEWLTEGEYSPRHFAELVDKLYPNPEKPTPAARDNARLLEDSLVYNWLIVPKAVNKIDDDNATNIWKSRDIASQQTIYVNVNSSTIIDDDTELLYLRDYSDFYRWQLSHGIQVYGYQLRQALEQKMIQGRFITIGEDSVEIPIVEDGYYDLEYGLHLDNKEEEDYVF